MNLKYISADGKACQGNCSGKWDDLTDFSGPPYRCLDSCPEGTEYTATSGWNGFWGFCISGCPIDAEKNRVNDISSYVKSGILSCKYIDSTKTQCIASCPNGQRPIDGICTPNGQCPEGYNVDAEAENGCSKSVKAAIGQNIPKAKFNRSAGWGIDWDDVVYDNSEEQGRERNKNVFFITGNNMKGVSHRDAVPVMSLEILRGIDAKADDGLPHSGKIRTITEDCVDGSGGNAKYKEGSENNDIKCSVTLDAEVVW
jgi:hypothetical protein